MPFAQERMGFERPPRLFLRNDQNNANDPLGKTAYYDPNEMSITLYVTGRHPKDVMRSLSHELVHHTQNCRGDLTNLGNVGEGYAQNDEHLREMEREAYETGNLCFRDWEDGIKGTIYFEHLQKGARNSMSTKDWKNNELNGLLMERFGFKFRTLNESWTLDEEEETLEETEVTAEDTLEETEVTAEDTLEETEAAAEETLEETECPAEETLEEDSGEDEAWHQWKNEHADDDHIKEIERHLKALRDDRDYERHEAEYDHDKYEDEGMKETVEEADLNTGMSGVDGDDKDETYMGHVKEAKLKRAVRKAFKLYLEKKS